LAAFGPPFFLRYPLGNLQGQSKQYERGSMTEFFTAGSCVGSLMFLALVIYAHLQRRELNCASTPLSDYFSGPTRRVMLAAYFCLGLALVCTAMKIIPEQQGAIVSGVGPASGVLMLIAAACLIPVAVTTRNELDVDTRAARTRSMHRVLALVAFTAIVIAMVAYSMLGLPSEHRYQRAIRVWAILLSIFAMMSFVLLVQVPPGSLYYGLIQKFLVALVAIWVLMNTWA
jgi:hypothetical protein